MIYGFPLDKSKISFAPTITEDYIMTHSPRIALDDALEPGQPIGPTIAAKLMSYLETMLPSDQLNDVKAILNGEEAARTGPAMDKAMGRHADKTKRRQSAAADFDTRFPGASRIRQG